LAAYLQFLEAAGPLSRGSGGSDPGFFCADTGAPGSGLALMEQVLGRLKDEYRATGNGVLFDWLKQLLPDEPGAPSRAKIAAKLGMTDNALRQAFRRFRHRYQILLREEIGHTVLTASEIEDELRHLIAVLRK